MTFAAIATPDAGLARRERSLSFPTSVGILLGVATCATLAAVVYGVSGAPLPGATFFVAGQFALSLALLRLYNGVWVLQDIRMPLVIFMFFYGATLPFLTIINSDTMRGAAEAAFLFGTAFVGFNFVQWWHKQRWQNVLPESFAAIRPNFSNALVFSSAFVGIVAYAWFRGTRQFLTLDRSQMTWLYTQAWIVANMIINGFAMFLLAGWERLSRASRWLTVLAIIAYVIFHLGLGNRHAFLPMFIFLVGAIASRRRRVITTRTILLALVAFLGLMAIGVVRQVRRAPWIGYSSDVLLGLAQTNEFTMPIQTVMYYISENKPMRYGATYLMAPGSFVPRALWPEKPVSLSLQFNRDMFGDIIAPGYAYTPITEAYINFGVVGPFIVLSLVSLATVFLVRHAREKPLLYFLCFALVIDFNRGESMAVIYPIVITGVAFWLMKLVSRVIWFPGRFNAASAPAPEGERIPAV